MSRGFSGGKQLIKFANAKNRGRVCLFQTTENEEHFILKTIMANYQARLPAAVRENEPKDRTRETAEIEPTNYGTGGTGVSDHCYFLDAVATVHVLTASNIDVKLEEIRPVHFA